MTQTSQELITLFTEKAQVLASVVTHAATMEDALAHAIELCKNKANCQMVVTENGHTHLQESTQKTIAGVNLPEDLYAKLVQAGEANNITVINNNLRNYLSGFDMSLSIADLAIAETGTIVCNSTNEDFRISTMVCEFHVAILPKSKIYGTALDVERQLTEWMANGPCYTAFISGPSRTADIERVLAIGVHGPIEMHVILLED